MPDDTLTRDIRLVTATMDDTVWAYRWAYYVGAHPRVYLSAKLREMFRGLADAMADNYCGLAVNARVSRLQVEGWTDPQAQQVWEDSHLPQRQDRMFRWALAHGAAVVLVDTTDTGPVLRVNRPTQACAVEDDADPDRYRLAAKRWTDTTGSHLTLYYPDEIVRLVQPASRTPDPSRWVPDPDDPGGPHGYDGVPAVALRPFADGPVLMDTLAAPQDRINKITSNKMVAGEFTAFSQRVFFTRQAVDPFDLRQTPDQAIVLDPGDPDGQARVEQLPAGSLTGYLADRNDEIDNLFTLASLPRHMRVNPGAPPSGAALRADEGPFTMVLADHQREIGEGLTALMALLGVDAEPVWRSVQADDDTGSTQAFATAVGGGIPWQMAAREYLGWSEEMVTEAEQLKEQAAAGAAGLGAALLGQFTANPQTPTDTPDTRAGADMTQTQADTMGVLIRAGVEPESAAATAGLDVEFTGAVPVSLRVPEDQAQSLE